MNTIYLLAPAILGYSAATICNIGNNAGKDIPFRPPSWVFGIVWPILYLLLGYSWVITKSPYTIPVYTLLSVLLAMWIVVYGCKKNKKESLYILIASVATSIAAFGISPPKAKLMLSPLITWLGFATLLNSHDID